MKGRGSRAAFPFMASQNHQARDGPHPPVRMGGLSKLLRNLISKLFRNFISLTLSKSLRARCFVCLTPATMDKLL